MEEQLARYERYARSVKRLSLLAGLWPGRSAPRFLRLVVVFQSLVSIVTTYGVMYLVVSNIGNIPLLTKSFGIAVGFCTILIKVLIFSIYRGRLVEMHEALEKAFRADLVNTTYRPVVLSLIEYFDRPTFWLSVTTLGAVLSYNLNPLVSMIMQRSHGDEARQYSTPFPSKYPFPEGSFLFVACYLVEMGASYAIGMITTSTDALFGFYVFQMASQLRVLSYRMHNLTRSEDHLGVIKECLARRQTLLSCRDKLQTIYGPIILWMLTCSALIICTNIFHVLQTSLDHVLLSVSVVIYILMKLMQSLLYGWCGLLLITESEDLNEAIYSSGWPGCGDKSFSTNILTMLMCKPLALKACQFYPITLDVVTAIINTALSYFFLLRTLDAK